MTEPGIDEADALGQIRSHWLSNLRHDLASPLFAARGYLGLIRQDVQGPLTADQQRYLTHVGENLDKLWAQIKELYDFPAEDAFEFHCLSIGKVLRKAVSDLRGVSRHRAVDVVASIPSGGLNTIGDPEQLASAVNNLLGAAVEIAGPGGSVEIHAREDEEKITLGFSATRAAGAISTLDTATSELAISFRIFKLHGGTTSATAVPGEPYTVTCHLPIIRSTECSATSGDDR